MLVELKEQLTFMSILPTHGYEEVGFAIIHKERKEANKVDSMTLIGNVKG